MDRIKLGTSEQGSVYWRDQFTHMTMTGKSGGGKSTLLAHVYQNTKGAKVLVEPAGFLANDCYSISEGKAMYCSLDTPISLNPLLLPYPPGTVVDIIVEAINQMIAQTAKDAIKIMTPNMLGIIDTSVRYCLEHNRKSLVNIRDFILTMNAPAEAKNGVIARLNVLLSDERMHPILCGKEAVNWGQLIAKGQSLIVDCSKMSRDKMVFMGTLVTLEIESFFRFDRPKEYRPLTLFLDEAANFLVPPVLSILREGRKFQLSAVISLIDFNIPEPILRSVLNVGTLVAFRCGYRESVYLAKEMMLKPDQIQFLEKHHIAFMTPKEKGIAKAPRPPYFKKLKPRVKKVELPRPSFTWSSVKSYQPEASQ